MYSCVNNYLYETGAIQWFFDFSIKDNEHET